MTQDRGRLIVLSAPSGAGKTTLVRGLLAEVARIGFSVSYTTRAPRPGEREGVDYFFVTPDTFHAMVARGEFLEHANVFDHWYGTSRAHVESLLAEGQSVLLEIDWQGARQVLAAVPDAISVFILPPAVAELSRRLRGRRSDPEDVIRRRLRDALDDMRHWSEFSHVVVNADVPTAVAELREIVAGRGQACRTDVPAVRARAERILASGSAGG
jgi:guanylate kinase